MKVSTKIVKDGKTGKPIEKVKFASAHDFRRSFGQRWALKVMPPVLMQLMRHASITTTLDFYVGRNAQTTAEVVWEAFGKGQPDAQRAQKGTVSGTIGQNEGVEF